MERDNWDGVWPPHWKRASFNSPEWGGVGWRAPRGASAPSRKKTERPLIGLLLLFRRRLDVCVCMVTPQRSMHNALTETNWWQVTWESRLPATPPPPFPYQTREKLFSSNPEPASKCLSVTRGPTFKCTSPGNQGSRSIDCTHFSMLQDGKIPRRAGRGSTAGSELSFTKNILEIRPKATHSSIRTCIHCRARHCAKE